MSSMNLENFSSLVSSLSSFANLKNKETNIGVNFEGDFGQETAELLKKISSIIAENNLSSSITLRLDEQIENWDEADFNDTKTSCWSFVISDKKKILQSCDVISNDIDGLLFFSDEYFKNEWLYSTSGLNTPESSELLLTDKPLKIFVHNLNVYFGGPRIAVIPTTKYSDELPPQWMQSTKLPKQEDIKKNIHLVTKERSSISTEKFLLTWGDITSDVALPFIKASSVMLLMTICQEYFSNNKVILNGKKRLELCLYSDLNNEVIEISNLERLKEIVEWCYAENDIETRVLLLVDRLSLDIKSGSTLFSSLGLFKSAFDEAKNRYRYVILERKKDYTKELSDLQKDVSGVVSSISKSTADFSDSLLKDILALAFILTAGVVSRRFVNEDVLNTPEATILFKSFSFYLMLSLILRAWQAFTISWQSEAVFTRWRSILRSHMSEEELLKNIDNSLFPVKCTFWITFIAISLMYIVMALCSWNAHFVFGLFGITTL